MSNRNGMNYRLPVKREPTPPPAPLWQQAAPVVIRGAALVAAGVIGEWLLRSATKKAVSIPFSAKKSRAIMKAEEPANPAVVAYSETVVVRRTIVRHG
jgi:hypothetical protein